VLKRKAASEVFDRMGKGSSFGDGLEKKVAEGQSGRKRNLSSETTSKNSIFKRRNSSNRRA